MADEIPVPLPAPLEGEGAYPTLINARGFLRVSKASNADSERRTAFGDRYAKSISAIAPVFSLKARKPQQKYRR